MLTASKEPAHRRFAGAWLGCAVVTLWLASCRPNLPTPPQPTPLRVASGAREAGPRSEAFVLGFSATGTRLASTRDFRTVTISEVPSLKRLTALVFDLAPGEDSPTFSWLGDNALALSVYGADGAVRQEVRRIADGKRFAAADVAVPLEPFSDALDPNTDAARGQTPHVFATPLGRVRLDVASTPDGKVQRAQLILARPDGSERRIDLHSSFAQDRYLSLRALGVFGQQVLLRSWASHGAIAMGRLGTVDLASQRVTMIQEPLSASADISIVGDRLALVQGAETKAWLFELPSLRRLTTFSFPDAKVSTVGELVLGDGPTCIALAPDRSRVALLGALQPLRWFDTATGRQLGELSVNGDYFSCMLAFAADSRHLVAATRFGGVSVVNVERAQIELTYDFTHCTNCDRQIASGNRELSSSASLSPDVRYFLVRGASAEAHACVASTCLVDLVTHAVTPLAAEGSYVGFDPSSRYFILGNALFSTQPVRRIAELP
ncbi:MAG: hypothetical protein ABI335_22810 [Polyangiaceae bacterium]